MKKETKWFIDQLHSKISFSIRHIVITHIQGSFKKFDANIYSHGNDFTNVDIDLWIEPNSIITDNEKRDEELKNEDFFDIKEYKYITFLSNTMSKKDNNEQSEIWGELSIKGVTKLIKLDVQFKGFTKDQIGNEKVCFAIAGKIDRRDWNLVWHAPLEEGSMLGNDVEIECNIELIKDINKELNQNQAVLINVYTSI